MPIGACAVTLAFIMHRLLILLLLLVALPCAAFEYHPSIYPLKPGLVQPLKVSGNLIVVNAQPATDLQIVYKYGTKLTSTMHEVTEVMVQQTRMEIGVKDQPPGPGDKVIELKVNTLLSKYKFFSWASHIQFEAKLGDGSTVVKDVPHASGVLLQDLNGCIAEGVMTLLNDPQVRTYIESPATAAVGKADSAPPAADPIGTADPDTSNQVQK
jgi:hypothetical protein